MTQRHPTKSFWGTKIAPESKSWLTDFQTFPGPAPHSPMHLGVTYFATQPSLHSRLYRNQTVLCLLCNLLLQLYFNLKTLGQCLKLKIFDLQFSSKLIAVFYNKLFYIKTNAISLLSAAKWWWKIDLWSYSWKVSWIHVWSKRLSRYQKPQWPYSWLTQSWNIINLVWMVCCIAQGDSEVIVSWCNLHTGTVIIGRYFIILVG